MVNELKTVGARIQEARKLAGINQIQLAEKINISVSHLSAIETGHSNFGVDILMRITEVLNVSADSLLRTNVSAVSAIHESEIAELIKGCSSHEVEAMIVTLQQMKEAFQKTKQKEN